MIYPDFRGQRTPPECRRAFRRRRDVGGRDVAAWADGGESRLGREPCARGDVKDVHTRCNVGCAQQEGHEVHRDVREGAVVLCRRLALEAESLRHPALLLLVLAFEGAFSTARWLDARFANHPTEPIPAPTAKVP